MKALTVISNSQEIEKFPIRKPLKEKRVEITRQIFIKERRKFREDIKNFQSWGNTFGENS